MINHWASLFHICGEKVELSTWISCSNLSQYSNICKKGKKKEFKLAAILALGDISCSGKSYLYNRSKINWFKMYVHHGPNRGKNWVCTEEFNWTTVLRAELPESHWLRNWNWI